MALPLPVWVVALIGLLVVYFLKRLVQSRGSNKLPLPPGPRGLPLIGNFKDLPPPGVLEAHHWAKHKDLYGPVSSITVLGNTFVIINDAQIALDLLRDRSINNSGRPSLPFCEMIGWMNTIGFVGYTDLFKTYRKNISKVAGSTTALAAFDRVQEEEAVHFLLNVLESPENLFDHIKREAGAVVLKIIYGYTVEPHGNDVLVNLVGKTMEQFADAAVPGRWAVDSFPLLKYLPEWVPGTNFKAIARTMNVQLHQTIEQPFAFVKQQMKEKRNNTSYVSQAIETIGSDPYKEWVHKLTAVSLYLGGADTTVSAIMTFFLAMTVYPEVQKKAQEELDRVLGDRLPISSDKDSLPYLDAVVKETHRWQPVAPMGLPHTNTAEDSILGYRLPKGATILPNIWWFMHDPSVYPDPMTFRPERFIDTPTHKAEPDPRNWSFGFGRRVCPGRFVADNALFLTIAQSLKVFKIEKAIDGNGRVIHPEIKFEAGVVSHPVPYRNSIEPRSEAHRALIKKMEDVYPWRESDASVLADVKY